MRRTLGLAVLILLAPVVGQAACIVSVTNVVFGVYNTFSGTPSDLTGIVTLSCSRLSNSTGAYAIKLSIGGADSSFAGRAMRMGGVKLLYQLYSDAARTLMWGDGTGGSSFVIGADNRPLVGGTSIFNVRGRVLVGQTVSPGTYGASIMATVSY